MAWFKRPFLAQARVLFWLNWVIGLAFALAPASSRDLLWAKELEGVFFAIVPLALMDFILILQNETINQVNRFVRFMLILLSVIIVTIAVLQSMDISPFFSLLRNLVLVTVSIGSLFAFWNLGALFTYPKDKPEKNHVNILLVGITIGLLPFVLLTAIPTIFGFQSIMNAHISALFISLIPFTWYYAIVNKYLPDSRRLIEILISNSVAGLISSIFISYALLTLKLPRYLDLAYYLSILVFFVVSIVIFGLIKAAISTLLEKVLFSEGKRTFKKLIFELNKSLDLLYEESQMLEEVVKTLVIEGAFIVVEDDKRKYIKKAVGNFLEKPGVQAEMEKFFQADQKINLDAKMLPDDFPAELYIPVISNVFACGIFLGHRCSRVKFRTDELPSITLISSHLAQRLILMIVTKELSKEINALAQKSFDFQRRTQGLQGITASLFRNLEKERKSIAHEIHDGPLQLVLDVDRRLKKLTKEVSADDRMLKDVSYMQELIEELSMELRLICNDLRPPVLSDLGLITAIELMCEEIMFNEMLTISLETVGISREDRFNEDVEVVAYRFLQEGVSNAVKHSNSNQLKIHIEMNDSKIKLTLRDSGKGFDTNKVDAWLLTGAHFGIIGMKERLESLGGDLQIRSIIGRGTVLKATIPLSLE